MPVFNVERYLVEAIDSVLAQTHRDFVLVVADDGSCDATLAIARSFEAKDPRVRVMVHPNNANLGIAHTMNAAIDRCDTDWIACMHGDDVMLPNRLERQLEFVAAHPELAVVSSIVDWIDGRGRFVGRSRSPMVQPQAVAELIARGGVAAFPHPAVMFRKSVVQSVGGYRQEFWPAEDTELWNRIAYRGHRMLVQNEVLLKYRLHGASASMSRSALMTRKLRWMERCIIAWRAGIPEPTWEQFLAERRRRPWWSRANLARKDLGRTMYQSAIGHYAARRYHRFAPALLGSAALEPEVVLGRILLHLTR